MVIISSKYRFLLKMHLPSKLSFILREKNLELIIRVVIQNIFYVIVRKIKYIIIRVDSLNCAAQNDSARLLLQN